ncbi:MAG TPA: phosphate signaling complex protein PhoU [Thermomicrobiales bacterium]|nr:phosphate signaling complex protein PhoU [Thermomicrobiales bacterium]
MTRTDYTSSIQGVKDATLTLASMVDKAISRSIEAFENWDAELAQEGVDGDDLINDARWQLEEEVILIIARQAPMARDLRELIAALATCSELERIGDYAKVVARTVLDSPERPEIQACARIPELAALGRQQLANCMEAFVEGDASMARRVARQDDEMDLLWNRIYRELLTEMIADPELVPEASGLLWIAHNFERMGDRVTNICERIIYAATGQFEENVHLAGAGTGEHD